LQLPGPKTKPNRGIEESLLRTIDTFTAPSPAIIESKSIFKPGFFTKPHVLVMNCGVLKRFCWGSNQLPVESDGPSAQWDFLHMLVEVKLNGH